MILIIDFYNLKGLTEEYAAVAQENADMINAVLDYTEGSNLLLEKLVSEE